MPSDIAGSRTLGRILDQAVEARPDNEAIIYVDRDYRQTYREFAAAVDRMAKGLMALGVEKGEKVAVWATNIPCWVTLQFATARIGAVLLTVNTNYKSAELAYLLRQSGCENLFLINGYKDCDYVQTVYELVPELKTCQRGYLQSEGFPRLRRVFFLGHEKHRGMYTVPEVEAMAVMVDDAAYEERKARNHPDDVVNMQYTSGTTGFPKGVMLTHNNIANNGFWVGENQHFTPGDRLCLPVPLFHCFGCVMGVLGAVTHASTMVILESFDPVQVMASVEEERCTALYGVPAMFIAVLEHKLFAKFDFSSLRTGIMAGSPCPVNVMHKVIGQMYMAGVTICYGLTEASPVITQTRRDDAVARRVETVGKPLPGVELKLVDPDSGAEVARGGQGEVCCRGYNVMKGYYNMPEATSGTIDADGWLHTGDLGSLDADGYLSITGRQKDMIIRGGENIYPREIEEFLFTMEDLLDVQVVGVPSSKYGEEVAAFVIVKEGSAAAPEDIRDFCRGRISWHKIPRYVAIVRDFPMTASGKVQKYVLRDQAGDWFPESED